jgi:hypothetical protein
VSGSGSMSREVDPRQGRQGGGSGGGGGEGTPA